MFHTSFRPFLRCFKSGLLRLIAVFSIATHSLGQSPSAFTQVIVFGDSISDDGNIARRVSDMFFLRSPGHDFDYADGRFTNSTNTLPPSARFTGVWHEQLTNTFLRVPAATDSLDGGLDYSYG